MTRNKQIIILFLFIGLLTILMVSVYTIRHQKVYGYYEDQYQICNYKYVCQIVNIDDLNTTITEHNFKYNLDTFNLVD